MKRNVLITICIALTVLLALSLVACTDGFSVTTYELAVEPAVEGVPLDAELTDEYVATLIKRVYLAWNDDSTTRVSLEDCKVTYKKVDNDTKLEIKIKFGKKSCSFTLPFVEPSPEPEEEASLHLAQTKMFFDDMTEADIKAAIEVYLCLPGEDEGILIESPAYEIRSVRLSDDRKSLIVKIHLSIDFIEHYEIDGEQDFLLYYNPELLIEGEELLQPGMDKDDVMSVLKLYIEDANGNKTYLDYICTLDYNDDCVDITIYAADDRYGFTFSGFNNSIYYKVEARFDKSQWKAGMTDEEIIAALYFEELSNEGEWLPYEPDPSVVITIEREDFSTVNVFFDGEEVSCYVLVGWDWSTNMFD